MLHPSLLRLRIIYRLQASQLQSKRCVLSSFSLVRYLFVVATCFQSSPSVRYRLGFPDCQPRKHCDWALRFSLPALRLCPADSKFPGAFANTKPGLVGGEEMSTVQFAPGCRCVRSRTHRASLSVLGTEKEVNWLCAVTFVLGPGTTEDCHLWISEWPSPNAKLPAPLW